jgi:hypothetical protein
MPKPIIVANFLSKEPIGQKNIQVPIIQPDAMASASADKLTYWQGLRSLFLSKEQDQKWKLS